MKSNQSSIYRLNMILALFQPEEASYSVRDIADILDAPPAVIRKDIVLLHSNRECEITFFPAEEEETDDFLEALAAGRKDTELLMADTGYHKNVFLSLSQMELNCLEEFLDGNSFVQGKRHRNYATKPLCHQARANMQVKASDMLERIAGGDTLRVTYRTREGETVFSTIRPVELVHNAMEDLYYVVTIEEGRLVPLRLDRIRRYEIAKEKIEISDLTPLEQLPNIWGMEMGPGVHVKLKILKEADVQHKVKRDLAMRTNGIWTEEGEVLYFEDEVIGINNFRSWLNSYGSSVVVLEPKSLRQEIMESARKRLEFYSK